MTVLTKIDKLPSVEVIWCIGSAAVIVLFEQNCTIIDMLRKERP